MRFVHLLLAALLLQTVVACRCQSGPKHGTQCYDDEDERERERERRNEPP